MEIFLETPSLGDCLIAPLSIQNHRANADFVLLLAPQGFIIVLIASYFRKRFLIRVSLATVLLEFPVSVIEWAYLAGLQPSGDTVEVECMVADSPSNSALFAGCRSLVGLALDAQIHNMVSADSTVVNNDIPSPQSNSIPLLHLESLLAICATF